MAEHDFKKFEDKEQKQESQHVEEGSHLDHPRVNAIKQHKLVNDLAYHLHHPQLDGPKGPSFPPQSKKVPKC